MRNETLMVIMVGAGFKEGSVTMEVFIKPV